MPIITIRQKEIIFVFAAALSFAFFSVKAYLPGGLFLVLSLVALLWLKKTEKKGIPQLKPVSYAGFWLRLGSQVVDSAFYFLFWDLVVMFFRIDFGSPLWGEAYYLCYLPVVFYMLKKWGQSPGKMAMGIKIVLTDFSEIGWKEIFVRNWFDVFFSLNNFLKYFLLFLGVLTADFVFAGSSDPPTFWQGFFKVTEKSFADFNLLWFSSELVILLTNKKKRALHDYLAGTIVVVEKGKNTFSKHVRGILVGSIILVIANIFLIFTHRFEMDKISAQRGNHFGEYELGRDYYFGWGVKKSYPDAFKWFQKSAVAGNRLAEYRLGTMYEQGLFVMADKKEAVKWYTLASKNHIRDATKALTRLGVEVK